MKASRFRELALERPDVSEGSHMGHADFRVRGKIFASLSEDESSGVVNLSLELQESFVERFPEQFAPVDGAWGMRGWTRVMLANARVGPV